MIYIAQAQKQPKKFRIALPKFLKNKKIVALIIGVAIFYAISSYFIAVNVNPVIYTMAEAKVRIITNKSLSHAVTNTINQNTAYLDLINVVIDNSGKIKLIQTNTTRINSLARETTQLAMRNMEDLSGQGIDIPLGTLSGIPLLSGVGPVVRVNMIPMSALNVSFRSEFKEAGINQTIHKIYIAIHASVTVVVPGKNQVIETDAEMIVCENLLIGEVPQTYLFSNTVDDMLNLVPN